MATKEGILATFALTRMEEGEQRSIAALVSRVLQRRFGDLDEETQAQIESLPSEAIEELSIDLLDFNSLADLTVWLRARVGNGSAEQQNTN